MRPQNVRVAGKLNPIMQKVLSNKKIAKALDQPRERKEFFGMIKGVSEGGVYKKEMRKLFGDLRSGKVRSRTINAKEVRIIAKELFPDSARRYEFAGPKPSENKSQDTLQNSSSKKAGFRTMRSSSKSADLRTTGSTYESKKAAAPTSNAPIAPMKIAAAKSRPTKHYSPGDSLKYEFAKPGFQSTKESEKKQDAEIKPVAPEIYAKEKKRETAKPLSPESREQLEFPKSTLSGNTDSAPWKKDSPAGIKTDASAIDDISANRAIQTEALKNSARRKMLAARENAESEKPKRGFFGAMSATMKNKQS